MYDSKQNLDVDNSIEEESKHDEEAGPLPEEVDKHQIMLKA